METAKNWLFICTGTLLLTFGLLGAVHTHTWIQTAHHAAGRVIREDHGPAHTTVAFTSADGRPQEYLQNGLVSLHTGEQVEVLYQLNEPQGACVNRWAALYSGSLFALVIGSAHLGGGLFSLLKRG